MALYIVWQRRDSLAQAAVEPRNTGLILMLMVGRLATEYFTTRLSFLLVLCGTVLFLFGREPLKVLIFPIAFLIFMIPIPSILMQKVTFPMQLMASNLAAASLQLVDIPVLREGNVILLPDASLEVAEACSGIRSFLSLLWLGTAFAYFTKKTLWERALLVLSCFPIAVLVNAMRVTGTGMIAHAYGMGTADKFFHDVSGYPLFLGALALLAAFGWALSMVKRLAKKSGVRP